MKITENQEQTDFNWKSLTSIPFGGPICILSGVASHFDAPLLALTGHLALTGQLERTHMSAHLRPLKRLQKEQGARKGERSERFIYEI